MQKTTFFVGVALALSLSMQAQIQNPLEAVAEYNLSGVNTFAQPDTDTGKAWGALFQFGRNTTFDYTKTYQLHTQTVADNDPLIWGNSFFAKGDGHTTSDWQTNNQANDTWHSVIAKSPNAPASYKGNNDGDPCPKGWHMPTTRELNAFLPTSFAVANFTGTLGDKSADETAIVRGKTISYQSDYRSSKKGVIYGIKKEKDAETAIAYRWRWADIAVEVTAVSTPVSTPMDEIANEDFWQRADVSFIQRILPASGIIAGAGGLARQRWETLFLWTSDVNTEQSGFGIAAWGYYDEEMEDGGIAPYGGVLGRYNAAPIRCIRDAEVKTHSLQLSFDDKAGEVKVKGLQQEYKDGDSFPEGARLMLWLKPFPGYRFKSARINGKIHTIDDAQQDESDDSGLAYGMRLPTEADLKIEVSFEQVKQLPFTLTYDETRGSVDVYLGDKHYKTGDNVPEGAELILDVTPKTGYLLSHAQINGQKHPIGDFKESDLKPNTYYMPIRVTEAMNIEVVFSQEQNAPTPVQTALSCYLDTEKAYLYIEGIAADSPVALYDIQGQLLISSKSTRLYIGDLPSGSYLLRTTMGNRLFTK